jgi:hypothetical protein
MTTGSSGAWNYRWWLTRMAMLAWIHFKHIVSYWSLVNFKMNINRELHLVSKCAWRNIYNTARATHTRYYKYFAKHAWKFSLTLLEPFNFPLQINCHFSTRPCSRNKSVKSQFIKSVTPSIATRHQVDADQDYPFIEKNKKYKNYGRHFLFCFIYRDKFAVFSDSNNCCSKQAMSENVFASIWRTLLLRGFWRGVPIPFPTWNFGKIPVPVGFLLEIPVRVIEIPVNKKPFIYR